MNYKLVKEWTKKQLATLRNHYLSASFRFKKKWKKNGKKMEKKVQLSLDDILINAMRKNPQTIVKHSWNAKKGQRKRQKKNRKNVVWESLLLQFLSGGERKGMRFITPRICIWESTPWSKNLLHTKFFSKNENFTPENPQKPLLFFPKKLESNWIFLKKELNFVMRLSDIVCESVLSHGKILSGMIPACILNIFDTFL